MAPKALPTNLLEAARYFADQDVCIEFVAKLRWADGPTCPICESTEHSYLTTRRLWKCKNCKKQYSVKKGTIFEDSAIPLDKWLCAIWLIAKSKNGISSHELGRSIGITQKSAWFVLHRIRLAMSTGSFESLEGTVEVDETFIGGKAHNMHAIDRDRKRGPGAGPMTGKTIVVGAVQRGGRVVAKVVGDTTRNTLESHVYNNVIQGSTVYTDDHIGYRQLRLAYNHSHVDHSHHQYVDDDTHTNTIENFWSVVKRSLHGTYVAVEPFHLFRYLDERMFTYNERNRDDQGRFLAVMAMVSGRRITYVELTGKG